MSTTLGRVKAGISGYHPGLQQELVPGMVHAVPADQWSDEIFEAVTPDIPVATVEAEVRPLRGRKIFGEVAEKEG